MTSLALRGVSGRRAVHVHGWWGGASRSGGRRRRGGRARRGARVEWRARARRGHRARARVGRRRTVRHEGDGARIARARREAHGGRHGHHGWSHSLPAAAAVRAASVLFEHMAAARGARDQHALTLPRGPSARAPVAPQSRCGGLRGGGPYTLSIGGLMGGRGPLVEAAGGAPLGAGALASDAAVEGAVGEGGALEAAGSAPVALDALAGAGMSVFPTEALGAVGGAALPEARAAGLMGGGPYTSAGARSAHPPTTPSATTRARSVGAPRRPQWGHDVSWSNACRPQAGHTTRDTPRTLPRPVALRHGRAPGSPRTGELARLA
jgi:hypothetical protein